MTRLITTIILATGIMLNLNAQGTPNTGKILAEVSKNIDHYKSIKIAFSFVHDDLQQDEHYERNGTLFLKGKKYKIDMGDNVIYYDGATMWNHLKNANEVNVIQPESDTTSGALDFTNPKNLFTVHEKDYKTRYLEDKEINNNVVHIIDLYPKNLEVDYHRIRVHVDKNRKLMRKVKVFSKDGNHYTLIANDIETNIDISENIFKFDKSEYPDVEVIDMRF
jgi:outer membrane lipoprotein-sorting protein